MKHLKKTDILLLCLMLAFTSSLKIQANQIQTGAFQSKFIQNTSIASSPFNTYFQLFIDLGVWVNSLKRANNNQSAINETHKRQIVRDAHGAIIRGDILRKEIALVFTGDEFADGGEPIINTLQEHNIKASFFLTGNFYSNPAFKPLIKKLKQDRHYLGAHSDKHLLYADWTKRDSLLVSKQEFRIDLQNNYMRMAKMGIKKADAPYFLPPFEWYNSTITQWTKEMNLQLINFSPGTLSTADYTYPEMGYRYRTSDEIYQSIIQYEASNQNGLNGFILLIHIGTDPRRMDKFYDKLDGLLQKLRGKGYRFVRINELLEQ